MITHNITTFKGTHAQGVPPKSPKFQGILGSNEHRKFIYERVSENNPFTQWDDVSYRGEDAHVQSILSYEECIWDKFKPLFLEIFVYSTGDMVFVHPSDIKKR